MSDTSLPTTGDAYARAQLTARQLQEQTGLSLRAVAEMDLSEFTRLAYGQTPSEAGIAAFNREQDAKYQREHPAPQQAPAAPQSAPQPPAPEYQGIDPNSPDYFHAWRAQRKSGGEGKGIFDSVGSQSDEYRAATRAQTGRTGWSQANVSEAPRLTDRFVNHDEQRDNRSVSQRFGTPGNSFQVH